MEETIRLTGVDIGYRDRRETKTVAAGCRLCCKAAK